MNEFDPNPKIDMSLKDKIYSAIKEKVSIIAKDSEIEERLSRANVKDPVATQAQKDVASGTVAGTTVGGLGNLLVGLGSVVTPGVGSLLTTGSMGKTLAATVADAGNEATSDSLVRAFTEIGIPEDRARGYSDRISQGDYVVIVEGTQEEITKAESFLSERGIQEWGVYEAPDDSSYPYMHSCRKEKPICESA